MALWQREMPYPAYRPHWLNCRLSDGSKVQALGFVLERHLPCYAGNLPDALLSQILASAKGRYGSTGTMSNRRSTPCAATRCRSQFGSAVSQVP